MTDDAAILTQMLGNPIVLYGVLLGVFGLYIRFLMWLNRGKTK